MTNIRIHIIKGIRYVGNSQTMFAPTMQNGDEDVFFTYGINGSLRKKEVTQPQQNTEYYLFNSQGNLKAYSDDIMSFAYYGYNAANTRTYKLSMFNTNQWINGQQQPIHPMVQSAMFYPNTYINFTQAGEYTKHYYNGTERIASRLGEQQVPISVENEQELLNYQHDVKEMLRNAIGQHLYDEPTDMQEGEVLHLEYLQPCGNSNAIYYYHPNHLSSTMYVTDMQQSVVQSFLYAPYGEIISEYNTHVKGEAFPKYAFNAKELDEETGMYYYEARYYAPPTFTSRDPLFEKYPTFSPYTYCMNNPIKYVDPDGEFPILPIIILWKTTGYLMEKYGANSNVKTVGYAMNHLIIAARTGTARIPDWGISKTASNFEINVANAAGFPFGKEGDKGNAFRHVLWQGIITKEMGAVQALHIGNAHEDNLKVDLSQRTFKNMSEADIAVDLLNNKIGRELGEKNKRVSNKTMAKLVAKEFLENGLWTTSQNKDGSISIKKTKITKEQYETIIKEIDKKGNNGLDQ